MSPRTSCRTSRAEPRSDLSILGCVLTNLSQLTHYLSVFPTDTVHTYLLASESQPDHVTGADQGRLALLCSRSVSMSLAVTVHPLPRSLQTFVGEDNWAVYLAGAVVAALLDGVLVLRWKPSPLRAVNHAKLTTDVVIAWAGVCSLYAGNLPDPAVQRGPFFCLMTGWAVAVLVSIALWRQFQAALWGLPSQVYMPQMWAVPSIILSAFCSVLLSVLCRLKPGKRRRWQGLHWKPNPRSRCRATLRILTSVPIFDHQFYLFSVRRGRASSARLRSLAGVISTVSPPA